MVHVCMPGNAVSKPICMLPVFTVPRTHKGKKEKRKENKRQKMVTGIPV